MKILKYVVGIILALILIKICAFVIFTGYEMFGTQDSYSDGENSGFEHRTQG